MAKHDFFEHNSAIARHEAGGQLAVIDPVRKAAAPDAAVERLQELLGYVEQVIKLDERPALRLSEHRLTTGQAFVLHQHELHALPGVTHDITDEDGAIWLEVQRLKRGEPPEPPDALLPWLELSSDPDRTPKLRDFLLRTVSKSEKDGLVERGEAKPEDCSETLDPSSKGQFDVRLRLEDRPQISDLAEQYIASSWLPWAECERPRRRSIAVYQKLFEIAQLTELGSAEQSIELVWGIGLSRWLKDGSEIDLPLLERLVEIEIGDAAGGAVRIRALYVEVQATIFSCGSLPWSGGARGLLRPSLISTGRRHGPPARVDGRRFSRPRPQGLL
jgi:hypothetical protein